jgi:hypothetical protein
MYGSPQRCFASSSESAPSVMRLGSSSDEETRRWNSNSSVLVMPPLFLTARLR